MPPVSEDFSIPSKMLFEMVEALRTDFAKLTVELQQTRSDMTAYNGLRQRLEALEQAEAKRKGQASTWEGIRTWVPVMIGICGLVYGFVK